MNKPDIVNVRGPLEADALRILREIPGVSVIAEQVGDRDRGVDATVEFAGSDARIAVEMKQRANAATAWQLVHEANANPDVPVLLIADQTTAEARDILQRHGVGVIDGLGNAHLTLPGLLLHIEGRGRASSPANPTRLRGKAGVVAQALLLDPDRDWHVRDLEAEARVARGLAHRVLARLEGEGVVTAEGSGPNRIRHVVNPGALLDLWAEENRDIPRRERGYTLARSPRELIGKISDGLRSHGIEYALTGTAAATLVAPFVTAVPIVELWGAANADPAELLDAIKAEPVGGGENVIALQQNGDTQLAFREEVGGTSVVNRFRLYVDLRKDPRRGREQADHLREEVIGF